MVSKAFRAAGDSSRAATESVSAQNLRVAFIIPSLRSGGCERQVANLLEDLQTRFRLELLIKDAEVVFPVPASIPIRCSLIGLSSDHGTVFKAWRFLRRIVVTGRMLRKGQYDVICTFIDLNNVVTLLAARLFRVRAPIVAVEQTVIPEYFEHDHLAQRHRGLMRVLLHATYGRVDRVIALTDAIADFLREAFDVTRPIDVIAPGVDSGRFHPPREAEPTNSVLEPQFLAAPIRLISVGGLIARKDPALLIRAMRIVVEAQPHAHLFLIGEGAEDALLRDLITSLELTEHVHMLGWRANVEEYVRLADVSLLASTADPLPQALLEALMSGVPVVTTRSTSEWDRILTDPMLGTLVKTRDEHDFATAVLEVLERADVKDRDAISDYARTRFERNIMAEAYGDVIAECLAAKPSRSGAKPRRALYGLHRLRAALKQSS